MSVLADAWAKFHRAVYHAKGVGVEIRAWVETQGHRSPFGIEFREDRTDGCLIIHVGQVPTLPNEWNLIIGDALFNFRASLDYLAWQLFQRGTEAHTHKPELVSWPIIGKQTDATSAFKGRLPGLLPHHQTLAEACQPYTGEPGKLHPLTILNDLSRQDKHRQIVMVLAAHKEYTIRGSLRHFRCERSVLPSSEKPVPLKPGTELVTWYGKRTDDHEPEMDVHFEGTTGIAFENGLWVLEVLARIEERIGNILANFEPLM